MPVSTSGTSVLSIPELRYSCARIFKMAEGYVNGEDKMPVGTVDQFKGHSGRPVVGILRATGRTEFGMTAKG